MNESAYKKFLLGVLLALLTFNYVERLALGLLLQDIKVDLSLSDTQLGLLTGIAFAFFYSVMGIPIARWADRGNRVIIITLAAALSSVAVILCGVSATFMQLLMIRVLVGIGEAGCVPPAHSLIADYFNRAERPKAVAIYKLGLPLSALIGFFVAGWLNEFYGWRTTFMILGVPGLGLAALAWLSLREPRRGKRGTRAGASEAAPAVDVTRTQRGSTVAASTQPTLTEVFVTLWSNTTFRHLLFCSSVAYFFGAGLGQWKPAFFIRSFGMDSGELGTWFALIYGGAGLLGTYWGGLLAVRYAANNERLQLRAMAVAYCFFGTIQTCTYLSPNPYLAIALSGLGSIGTALGAGPIFATIQTLVPDRMRAMSIALLFLFSNLVGLGLGPLAVGAFSDAMRPWLGDESLRYALMMLSPGYAWCAWHVWTASNSVTRDLEAVQSRGEYATSEKRHDSDIENGFHGVAAKSAR